MTPMKTYVVSCYELIVHKVTLELPADTDPVDIVLAADAYETTGESQGCFNYAVYDQAADALTYVDPYLLPDVPDPTAPT